MSRPLEIIVIPSSSDAPKENSVELLTEKLQAFRLGRTATGAYDPELNEIE